MNMIIHNLKVAVRNLMKYKLQATISVLSIAVGIVTLALVHSYVSYYKIPIICSQPHYERAYTLWTEAPDGEKEMVDPEHDGVILQAEFTSEMIHALKRGGGLKTAERIAVPNSNMYKETVEFQLCDSTKRKFDMRYTLIDPENISFVGPRSAITGQPVRRLRPGEVIISQTMAATLFGTANPVGAVCPYVYNRQPLPITIVDVFEDVSRMEKWISNDIMYFSHGEIEDFWNAQTEGHYYTRCVNIVLKEGCTEAQLAAELEERLEPFNRTVHLEKVSDNIEYATIINIQLFSHLAGSLILLAAVIGFLRMQMQLFWMRRREVSLRMVNGAKRGQLFRLLFTEVFIVVLLAVGVSMMMGVWVENFIYTRFTDLMRYAEYSVKGFAHYGLYIGAGLLLVCALVIWLTLVRICNAGQGLATNMRRSRTHLFRNVMLGLQVTICIVFMCATLIVADWGNKIMELRHLPDDLTPYKESILLQLDAAGTGREALKREIAQLPSLQRMVPHASYYTTFLEVMDNEDAKAAFNYVTYWPMFHATDTALVGFLQGRVNWFKEPMNTGEFLLLNEDLYNKLRGLGIAGNDMLTLSSYTAFTLPIAGTVPNLPYAQMYTSILVHPGVAMVQREFVLIPRKGKYKSLMHEVDSVIQCLEPSIVEKMAQNFHESHYEVRRVEAMRNTGWILAAVSILICAMSIYSTIALDTRSRQKEVAIRKINGAKSGDIYRLFGRLYLMLVAIALVVALPVALKFREMFYDEYAYEEATYTPLATLFAAGSLIVIVLIAAIVTWNIRNIMRTNPSEIIAKE